MSFLHFRRFLVLLFCLIFPIFTCLSLPTTASESKASLSLSILAVPEEIGKVQERFVSNPATQPDNNPRTIIQIQDAHANITAQQNIAAILERLRAVFGIEKVALEGAWVSTSLPKSHAIPTSREKQLFTETLLEDDRISGPVSAAIMSPKPIMLVGIEDETSYEKNRALFLAHLEKAKEIDEKLLLYGASLQASQRLTWMPELLAFGNAFGKFRETSDLGKFLPFLLETTQTQNINISDFPQITLVRDIMTLEKLLQKKQLEQEVKRLTREYKDTPWTLEELIRSGKIPPEKIGLYPEIKKLTRLYQMRDEVSLRNLTDQIGTLTGRILEKLIGTPEERALWGKTERFYLSKKILLLQATPEDIKTYDLEKPLFETELATAGLSEPLALSDAFYEVVKKRDEIFFDKIVNDPSLTGNIAIVTGGFHTDGLSQKFRDSGISYITITPELGNARMNEKLYEARIGETRKTGNDKREPQSFNVSRSSSLASASANRQTLSELRNALKWIDNRFQESYEVLLQTRDVRQAKKFFAGEDVTVPKSAKISHLIRKGRIVPEPQSGTTVNVSRLRVSEFMAKSRSGQVEAVQSWLEQASKQQQKAMLVSSVSILARMLAEEKTVKLLNEAVSNGDIIALAQDVPVTKTPEILSSTRGIDRFEASNISMLLEKTPRFQRLAKKRPFAIMENHYPRGTFVVLPEKPISLALFKIITLNPNLYQAAKDPAFLARLQDIVSEILSQEVSGKAA